MIIETGRIVAIEADGLWVETVQRSTCGTCAAEKGCGQSLMSRLVGHTSYLRVLLQGRESSRYQLGDEVEIGVPESVVAKGSLFVYLLPLLTMILFSGIVHHLLGQEGPTTLAALIGLFAGALLVRWRAHVTRNDHRLQPVLIDEYQPLHLHS